jgi:hypothetical protein
MTGPDLDRSAYEPTSIKDQDRLPDELKLAEAYIPYQKWGRQYSYSEALMKGTLWPALYRPYP